MTVRVLEQVATGEASWPPSRTGPSASAKPMKDRGQPPASPLDCSQASMWEAIGTIAMGHTLFDLVDGSCRRFQRGRLHADSDRPEKALRSEAVNTGDGVEPGSATSAPRSASPRDGLCRPWDNDALAVAVEAAAAAIPIPYRAALKAEWSRSAVAQGMVRTRRAAGRRPT